MADKKVPMNMDAERSILSSILMDQNLIGDIAGILSPDDFYSPSHRKIYEAAQKMYSDGLNVDPITLAEYLKGDIQKVGGRSYIAELFKSYVPVDIMSYVKIIKDCSNRRFIANVAAKMYSSALEGKEDIRDLMLSAVDKVFELDRDKSRGPISADQCVNSTMNLIQENAARGGGITGIPTGFKLLDESINGLNKGDFIVVAARASMGKTAFAMNIAVNVAKEHTTAIFSLEMPKEQLVERMLSMSSSIKFKDIRRGCLNIRDIHELQDTSSKLSKYKFFIDDTCDITVGEIKAKCRKIKAKYGLDLVVVDYIGLIRGAGKCENRQQEISSISRQLKRMAMELDTTVIAVSQLNRAPEARRGNKPQLSDLRESGAIEQDADIVLLLYREDYYNKDAREAKGKALCIIAKNRNGEVGEKTMGWYSENQRFLNYCQ